MDIHTDLNLVITVPHDVSVRTAAAVGAYLNRVFADAWVLEGGEHTSVSGANEPLARAIIGKIREIIDHNEGR